jgi:hypothetical protein
MVSTSAHILLKSFMMFVENSWKAMVLSHKSQYMEGPDFDASEVQEPLEQYSFYRLARVADEFYGMQCWKKYAESFRWWKASDQLVTRRLLP